MFCQFGKKTYNLIAFNELAVYSMGWSKSCLLVAFLQFGKNSLIIFTGFFLSFSAWMSDLEQGAKEPPKSVVFWI
jgi:hypothetical protein